MSMAPVALSVVAMAIVAVVVVVVVVTDVVVVVVEIIGSQLGACSCLQPCLLRAQSRSIPLSVASYTMHFPKFLGRHLFDYRCRPIIVCVLFGRLSWIFALRVHTVSKLFFPLPQLLILHHTFSFIFHHYVFCLSSKKFSLLN